MFPGVTSIARSKGSKTMATSNEYVSNPSVVAADQERPIKERNVVCCVGRVEIQIEIWKGWCAADTDSKL